MGLPFNPEYGLIAVFCVVLVQQLGAPLPVLPVMLFAGAQSARDPFYGIYALALAIVASSSLARFRSRPIAACARPRPFSSVMAR